MITFDEIRKQGSGIRVHGNGFIQIDLPDNKRVNVWGHPAIPRQNVATQLHDHRFDFYSFVLRGAMVNATYTVYPALPATHDVYTPMAREGEDTILVPFGEPLRVRPYHAHVYAAGESYRLPAGMVHETFVNQPTATLMLKGDVRPITPRVFCSIGKNPDNDFVRHQAMGEADLWEIVRDVFA
ncbi:hypothetical protein EN780_03235 [Mesorhizobium sp. M4B.F.Ca.ET.089.01.1.1]|uniref:hypothetical protein n=1 Tax=Mesorhizobium sp. M4B.F.Ca.ET.089.01.1.1 TaxID=2496662 RepID=UPI000FE3C699|nr:hypothetical protein [Mesorhizobium sp. M4B.F.Ca.ET.089.01.1.1]RWX70421.1 hypothetical protein EN780_03235 [Mesorhizobium sp. M4B.F.Ca.ET.089.01.1.1]